MSCRRCVFCAVYGQPTLCLSRRGYGFRPRRDEAPHFQGGFADYLNLRAGSTFFRIDATPEAAVLLEPLSIGVHQVSRIDLQLGSTVVIQGAGAIGLLTLAAAKQAGATRTIVVGAPRTRLDLARAFGADVTIDLEAVPDAADRIAAARAETPGGFGADVVFECAGVPSAIVEGIEMMRRGGTFVEAGHYTDHGDIALNPFRHIVNKQGTLVGVWGADVPHFVGARAMIEAGAFPFAELVSHTLPLERVGEGIGAIGTSYRLDGQEIRKIVVAAEA
jgi:L-iditol 2-dehydrogenase